MFEISQGGVRLGSVTPLFGGIIVRDAAGSPLGQVAHLAAAIALLTRVREL